jgi:hypothetical protein
MTAIDLTNTITVNALAEHVWRIVGDDFAGVSRWATSVRHSTSNTQTTARPAGAPCDGRSCELTGFGATDERLVEFDPTRHALAYTVTAKKLPSFVKGMRNDWSIETGPNGTCKVTARITADATGPMGFLAAPMMKMKLRSTIKEILDDLRTYAESGTVSETKRKALAKT